MFVVVYRWRLKAGHEAQFAQDWREVTMLALERYGSRGSSLFKAQDESYVAIAHWPNRKSRERFFARKGVDPVVRERMRAAIEEDFPPLELDTLHDLWTGA